MPELCSTFRKQAGFVWRRMQKAQSLGMSLSEETITEIVLYEIALAHQSTSSIAVSLATKPQEAKHGADWEWWLVKGGMATSFRVQAKRLFYDGKYQSLLKSGADPYEQAKKLIAAAKHDGHTPLYCFYNFDHGSGSFSAPGKSCAHDYRGPSYWGCTLALPDAVIASMSDRLQDLRPIMQPWHRLVCEYQSNLPDAGIQFVSNLRDDRMPPDFEDSFMYRATIDLSGPHKFGRERERVREIPPYVSRLLDLDRSRSSQRSFIDRLFWSEATDAPEDLAGIAVFDDRRG